MPSSLEIRQQFLDFFTGKGHTVVPSSSLIPKDDPTLLFTNAGMNQFKDVFLGYGSRPYTRAVDSQKCMRVSGKHNDLEEVGVSPYHHTFFEMLGNWSFGDYYKKEAITWAWELLTEVWKLPKEHLYATVFEDDKGDLGRDEEAAEWWRSVTDIDQSHILFFGRKDNLWEMGDTGPCGPCSEIHLDRGPDYCEKAGQPGHVCQVNGDCHRIVELWNLVFIQYNHLEDDSLVPLPKQHIDTGAGFERLVSVLQNKTTNYGTDLFTGLTARIQHLLGHDQATREENETSYQVIADHCRASSFLIADGTLPGNLGRNYVLRMIIRRAARFGYRIGFTEPFLASVAETVIEEMHSVYPELSDRRQLILTTLTNEEERFRRTLQSATVQLGRVLDEIKAAESAVVPGDVAFDLYATYGLPLEITRDEAQLRGIEVDEDGFKQAQEQHREVSGTGVRAMIDAEKISSLNQVYSELAKSGTLSEGGTTVDPYGDENITTEIAALLKADHLENQAQPDDKVDFITAHSPFYIEAGGQVADTGVITGDGWSATIESVSEPIMGLVLHHAIVEAGTPKTGDQVTLSVNNSRRSAIRRNHTATHLLHHELGRVLGDHVLQQGSLVAPDRLRFDFNHVSAVSTEELHEIQNSVNQAILRNHPVNSSITTLDSAKKRGAMALFGEKYDEQVRVIQIGDAEHPMSLELCGGTHVNSTGEIGYFVITSEGSVGTNLRRIEAVTGAYAFQQADEWRSTLEQTASVLNVPAEDLVQQVESLSQRLGQAKKRISALEQKQALVQFKEFASAKSQHIGTMNVLITEVDDVDLETMRSMADWFRDRESTGVVALGSVISERPVIIVSLTDDLVTQGLHAGDLARQAAKVMGGGGGGRPNLAQAGGKETTKLTQALDLIKQALKEYAAQDESA